MRAHISFCIFHRLPLNSRYCFLKTAVYKMSKQGASPYIKPSSSSCGSRRRRKTGEKRRFEFLRVREDLQLNFHLFLSGSSVPHQGDVWAECAGVCGG